MERSEIAREVLEALADNEREMDILTEGLQRIKVRLTGLSAQELSDMPRAPSPPTDKWSYLIHLKNQMEEQIRDATEAQRKMRDRVTGQIKKLKSADDRQVLLLRYLYRMDWADISASMYGSREDYAEKEDSYLRKAYRRHASALEKMADIIIRERGMDDDET